ncbi:Hypothetical protein LLA12_02545 [Lactococcus lactis subsp. lactis]|nr:Hypothetical protein LLA12_02545 [Lactococcus lactis subsp. lactis]
MNSKAGHSIRRQRVNNGQVNRN